MCLGSNSETCLSFFVRTRFRSLHFLWGSRQPIRPTYSTASKRCGRHSGEGSGEEMAVCDSCRGGAGLPGALAGQPGLCLESWQVHRTMKFLVVAILVSVLMPTQPSPPRPTMLLVVDDDPADLW